MPPVICFVGPTATDKSSTALALVNDFPLEIVSVDSAMVYRGMDIGTAKPNFEERSKATHHLIDIRDPSQPYSAAEFRQDTLSLIKEIHCRNKIPLLTGGTMLYFKILSQGISPLPEANPEIRTKILQEAEHFGWPAIHQRLREVDPESANRIHANDPQRLQRALEVFLLSGIPLSKLHKYRTTDDLTHDFAKKTSNVNNELPYNTHWIGFMPNDRQDLRNKIKDRFGVMLEKGFIQEVQTLFHRNDLTENLPAIKSVGYRQIWQYLQNKMGYSEMVESAIIATSQLAKRQMTWIRNWPHEITLINSQAANKLQLMKSKIQSIICNTDK